MNSTTSSADFDYSRNKVDFLIGSKLQEMSALERAYGLDDLHGVPDLPQIETAEIIQEKTEIMNLALSSSHHTNDRGYKTAISKSPDHVERLKLAFLRAEHFDSHQAAARLIRFFDCKLEHFGLQKIAQGIRLCDFNREEADALDKGIIQILPQRDSAGRAVIFIHGRSASLYSSNVVMRLLFFMAMLAMQDEETQQKGIVGIYYGLDQQFCGEARVYELWKTWSALPWRTAAFHMCINDTSAMNEAAYELCSIMKHRDICRFRLHNGSVMECLYNLSSFGVPQDMLPVSISDGTVNLKTHHIMVEALRRRETDRHLMEDAPATKRDSFSSPSSLSSLSEIVIPCRHYGPWPSTQKASSWRCQVSWTHGEI